MLFGRKISVLYFLLGAGVWIALQSSCKNDPAAAYSSFVSPEAGTNLKSGQGFPVKVDFGKSINLDSVVYFLDSARITSKKDTTSISIKTDGLKLGNHILMVKIYHDGRSEDLSSNVNILAAKAPELYDVDVVKTFPHDTTAYTEGFEYHDGFLYEGTGEKGNSYLRKVNMQTGKVLQEAKLDSMYFGEGITILGNKILQITWQEKTAFVYDKASFKKLATLPFSVGESGWGLTFDGSRILNTDGTNTIYFLDPVTYKKIGSIDVFDDQGPVKDLNELEVIDGKIYANVFTTNFILIINPETGAVEGKIDLSKLVPKGLYKTQTAIDNNVLNGIAYDKAGQRIFVTGKKWPHVFEIKLRPKN